MNGKKVISKIVLVLMAFVILGCKCGILGNVNPIDTTDWHEPTPTATSAVEIPTQNQVLQSTGDTIASVGIGIIGIAGSVVLVALALIIAVGIAVGGLHSPI